MQTNFGQKFDSIFKSSSESASKIADGTINKFSSTVTYPLAKSLKKPSLPNLSFPKFSKISKKAIFLTLAIAGIVLVAILYVLVLGGRTSGLKSAVTDLRMASTPINRNLVFPIVDKDGKPSGIEVEMNVANAELIKRILIKGQPAQAKDGKIFLIYNLELVNDSNKQIKVRPVDLVRLVDPSGKLFAPDIHNDAVEIEPTSTKKTRVGYVVDEGVKNFTLQVGEIGKDKQTIEVNF
ncbi:MAG TPA: hypothetical protein VIK81_01405 [Patescibacteria group bacterium]